MLSRGYELVGIVICIKLDCTSGEHVYIVMELLEGTSLIDHVNSLAERGSKFTEARIWKIFLQLVLALRYLHKEKRVVHRDLSPANLMLSEEDKLTISMSDFVSVMGICGYGVLCAADFGLAKQKQQDISVMKSVVGTVLYWWYVCMLSRHVM